MRRQILDKVIAGLVPAGVLGLSVALAPPPAEGAVRSAPAQSGARAEADVAARLTAIREAVTAAMPEPSTGVASELDTGVRKVWFGNHGWGRPWRWGGGWGNGGWGNWHPWGNGGWGNWHPWGNF